ncbi:beta-ketoacyl synthase, N-terminal domain protein [Bacillus mycoides]|nr:beta-ketoacyl synthase, N-terminal domain protein [Bacillus mycoides]
MDACLFHCKYPGIGNTRIFTEEQHNHDGTGLSQVVLNAIFNLVCRLLQKTAYEMNTDKTIEHAADGIAIIGMSGQFPKANSVTEFWDNLVQGKNCVSEVPKERWDWRKYAAADKEGQSSLQWGGFIEGIGEFDPLFFGISPKEAANMDPQEFLLLIHAWKAMEDAGLTGQVLSSRPTGVFVAAGNTDGERPIKLRDSLFSPKCI